jgi:hypothetical protein
MPQGAKAECAWGCGQVCLRRVVFCRILLERLLSEDQRVLKNAGMWRRLICLALSMVCACTHLFRTLVPTTSKVKFPHLILSINSTLRKLLKLNPEHCAKTNSECVTRHKVRYETGLAYQFTVFPFLVNMRIYIACKNISNLFGGTA